jgi:hypothetical protein
MRVDLIHENGTETVEVQDLDEAWEIGTERYGEDLHGVADALAYQGDIAHEPTQA